MAAPNFEIRISGYPYGSTGQSPTSELPQDEKDLALKFGLTEEQWQRSKLALAEKSERIHARAVELGHLVESVLEPLGEGYRLKGVARNIDTTTWTLRIETPKGLLNVPVSWELVDDVLDAGTKTEFNRLKNMVLFGLGRPELIFRKS